MRLVTGLALKGPASIAFDHITLMDSFFLLASVAGRILFTAAPLRIGATEVAVDRISATVIVITDLTLTVITSHSGRLTTLTDITCRLSAHTPLSYDLIALAYIWNKYILAGKVRTGNI
jgi:hypothetical protein